MSEWYKVGKIVNTHGVKGEIRVISSTDFADDRYAVGTKLMIQGENNKQQTVVVRHHRKHKNFDLLQLEGYHSINDVEPFKGSTLYVSEEYLEELEENEFYYHEIIGCTVVTEAEENLGKVKEIFETGANDVWVVQRAGGGKDLLLPYIEDVVKEIDIENKVIRIHLLEGLLE
ncbi:16S rRNA processing protein RimM [Halalkalibacter wakoensis JCM 9140]|uniref:Ribosome maturation factor RimM n=1 Tax=Halalkalibacter wakoensis JCM 9140 TaxID=1236970 RepID=W4PWI9_9BACI|nr:ribosome maturation factor RimM [Halalkalibacter wakoensis]GAE24226.1 16S rRNA processing protein RimM [Halalkalibacter wakoensis JCM 9140]